MERLLDVLIVSNGVAMFIRIMQTTDSLQDSARLFCASWDTYFFISCKLLLFYKKQIP